MSFHLNAEHRHFWKLKGILSSVHLRRTAGSAGYTKAKQFAVGVCEG
jgi:hypothetical protein